MLKLWLVAHVAAALVLATVAHVFGLAEAVERIAAGQRSPFYLWLDCGFTIPATIVVAWLPYLGVSAAVSLFLVVVFGPPDDKPAAAPPSTRE